MSLIEVISSGLKRLLWVWILLIWLLYIPSAFAVERIPLTIHLLQERILAPILSDGVATVDLRNFNIDLSEHNSEF